MSHILGAKGKREDPIWERLEWTQPITTQISPTPKKHVGSYSGYVLTNAGYVSMYVLVIMKGIYITSFKYFGFKGFETGFFFDLMVAVGTDFPSQKLRASL